MESKDHHVVIVGGGFGGIRAAQYLKHAPVRVTLIDRRNFHLFQPLLYQVATGGLSPANIAAPLRAVLKHHANTRVLLGEVVGVDVTKKEVILKDGRVPYDTLILAAGSRHHYFGKDQWEELAPGLKTVEDATEIRRRVLLAFEQAERENDLEKRKALMTFVIVGGGPTGVELAGALSEIARLTMRRNFRNIDPGSANIILLEGAERILPPFPPELSAQAQKGLEKLGVNVRTRCSVTDLKPGEVIVKQNEKVETIPARTVMWAAGVAASPLGKALAQATGCELDKGGRIVTAPDLTVPGHPNIFVIGDLAHFKHGLERPLPGVAPVAMQQGRYVADLIQARLRGKSLPPFKYRDKGSMATIGRSFGVVDLGWLRFTGFFAWLTWLFVHLMYLVRFENRVLVFFQWAWNYITRGRSARLITETWEEARQQK
ncbi:MAG TPA: NAD(P)/FAD-dependent oxidoreductase [Planctomycetota bacterium]|nr:NAD(P)/FAD-dependent oxidoreductase [Planctomycetota bacterium]